MWRYAKGDVDNLVEQERKGAPEFFSSQIIIPEEQLGSGTCDLRMVHGLSDAKHDTKSRPGTARGRTIRSISDSR